MQQTSKLKKLISPTYLNWTHSDQKNVRMLSKKQFSAPKGAKSVNYASSAFFGKIDKN